MAFEIAPINNEMMKYIDQAYEIATAGSMGMPKLALKTSNSNECKEGTFPVNSFALKTNKLLDLGKEVVAVVAGFRALALDWSDSEKVVATADFNSDDFKRIQALCNSGKKDLDALFAPEFLLYLPKEKKYCTLLMAGFNAKTKGCDGFLKNLKDQKPVVIKACKAENKKGVSFYPIAEKLLTDVDMSGTTQEEWTSQILNFSEITKPKVLVEAGSR